MVETINNGIRKVKLGDGTTTVCQCIPPNSTRSNGILFCNKEPLTKGEKNRFQGDEVIIEITDFKGVVGYMSACADLLKSWNIDKEQLDSFNNLINTINKL